MDGNVPAILGLVWLCAGIFLALGAVGWALWRMTIRGLIYLGGLTALIILGGQSLGWGTMIGIGGIALLGGPLSAVFLVFVPLGILLKLGPDARGGTTTLPAPETSVGGGGEVTEQYEENRPPRQICSKGCVILADGEVVSVPDCRLH